MRYAAGIEYDGSGFLGWQRLAEGPTVQAAVESALGFVVNHRLDVTCAGRTDSGVHARCQVVHFDTEAERTPYALRQGGNSRLPAGVSLLWCQPVAPDFHARYAARARRYRYTVLNRRVRPAMHRDYLTWERHPLDADAMHVAAQSLVGEHDFSAFRTVHCQARHARRNVHEVSVRRLEDRVVIEVQANAFLHHMVRNFVGSLLLVGRGEQPGAWIAGVLEGRDRTLAGPTAPSNGLVFLGPRYPHRWGLPDELGIDGD
ncbi:MAG TPA: tRNA pseudouridine(38-40) synthase TruA [Arenimonas sp.]|nr:tRNA pseudouridine(38-40) synthase TruA [Arenimonas sp.]